MTQLHDEMALGIGGSESAILLGYGYNKTPEDLYNLKRGLVEPEDLSGVPDIQRGNALEETAIMGFAIESGLDVYRQQEFLQSGAMVGHLDGVAGAAAVLEVKCPRGSTYRKTIAEGAPAHYQIQCQHYMELTGLPLAYLVLFCADAWELHVIEIPRNERLIKIIRDRCEAFWAGIQTGEFVDFPRYDKPVPKIGGDAVSWAGEGDLMDRIRTHELAIKEHKAALVQAEGELVAQWPEGAKKVFGDYGQISYVQNKGRVSLDTKRLQKEKPDIWDAYRREGRPSQYFRKSWKRETNV
ncbi:MAG: YqaJ viral recombinase family protein [Deltaproteobacteria bacterium]|nr:YqaJ viral recombinase family protein [Deltaproteobacteria bacterium]